MTAIIIGASSGIGRAIAVRLARSGVRVGVAARRVELLEELARSEPMVSLVRSLDAADPQAAQGVLADMFDVLEHVDVVYIAAGTGFENPGFEWPEDARTIAVNVLGFSALASLAFRRFLAQGHGHIVGISSVAGIRATADGASYSASKAYVSRYLQGLRYAAAKARLPVNVTDVRPGFVDTAMMKAAAPFWVASADDAAREIVAAAKRRARVAYVPRRWQLVAWLLEVVPDAVFVRLMRAKR